MSTLTFKRFLKEAPLPSDWDVDIFDNKVPFSKRIKYAMRRAARLGVGSSRVAFVVPYQGRDTVLKIAKNNKGMAQNEHEVSVLTDRIATQSGLLIPLIDYDKSSHSPTWVHTEYARKATASDFKRYFGLSNIDSVVRYAMAERDGGITDRNKGYYKDIDRELPSIQALVELLVNYPDISAADFTTRSNWGVYKDHPVIIDVGASIEIMKRFYWKL